MYSIRIGGSIHSQGRRFMTVESEMDALGLAKLLSTRKPGDFVFVRHEGKIVAIYRNGKRVQQDETDKSKRRYTIRDPDRVIAEWRGHDSKKYKAVWFDKKQKVVVYVTFKGKTKVWRTYDHVQYTSMKAMITRIRSEARWDALMPFERRSIYRKKSRKGARAKPLSSSK